MQNIRKYIVPILGLLLWSSCQDGNKPEGGSPGEDISDLVPPDVTLQDGFTEEFSATESAVFDFSYRIGRDDFRYFSGVPSLSEANTDILMLRIDPADPAGSGRGPEILSKDYTFYGSYSVRVKLPDIRKVQPNTGAIACFSVYGEDSSFGRSEIYIEWRVADPEIIYLGTVTGVSPQQNSITRVVNLADGEIYRTVYASETVTSSGSTTTVSSGNLSGMQDFPQKVSALDFADASDGFITCGFNWYTNRIEWWVEQPSTKERTVLWSYVGTELFPGSPAASAVPVIPAQARFEFWHSKLRPAETNTSSIAAPLYEYEVEVDSISYEPFEDQIQQWQDKYGN